MIDSRAAGDGRAGSPSAAPSARNVEMASACVTCSRERRYGETPCVASFGVLECVADGLADPLQLPRHAVPGQVEALRDGTFRQVLDEAEPGYLEPLDAARHDGEPLAFGG